MLTEALAPWLIVTLLPMAVTWEATSAVTPTLGWGLLVAVTSSLLPMAVIVCGARCGRWDGHHVRNREGRLVPFLILIASSSLGLTLLIVCSAPWPIVALDVVMLVLLCVTAGITRAWKVSVHSAVAAGATVVLVVIYGPVWWCSTVAVAAIAWSRVRVRDHTTAQVLGGVTVGALAGGGLFTLLL